MSKEKRPDRAIAISYDQREAPRVSAKGTGAVAQEILRIAEEHEIPINEDPALVEVLSGVPLGEHIPEALFIAVAEILAYVYYVAGREPSA